MGKTSESDINYPHFIIDKPEGRDLYEGQSQETLAENIVQFITENEENKRKVIGIEGEWGSGKSNVIEILKTKLFQNYYFFIFDAWGHQEDLTRRSILEGLLTRLIDDKILKGKSDTWKGKLKTLLAKKIETEHRSIPKLSWAVIISIIGILLIPGTQFIAEQYLKVNTTDNSNPSFGNYLIAFLIVISSFVPLVVWIVYSICKASASERKKVIEELFYIYKGEEIENTSEETISENEPSVLQFIKFLSDLETNSIKRLVIVFDNMDRLPSDKVKEVWSSIHTFFASDENNLTTWAIVPFDNGHISSIFNEPDANEPISRADSYIHKTFSIVFHVSPPILSDWRKFFNDKFKEAFGDFPPFDQHIESTFDYHHLNDPKIKPRDIIYFVNDLVALKKLWKEEIELKYLALFALKRDLIMSNPFKELLHKNYLEALSVFFESDDHLDTNMSALAFNVPLSKADEILLRTPIESVLKGQGSLIEISKHKSFFTIFDSAFYSTQLNIIHTISALEELPKEFRDQSQVQQYWEKLSYSIVKLDSFDETYVKAIRILIQRLTNRALIELVLRYLFKEASTLDKNGQKPYAGDKYYELINDTDSLLREVWPDKQITDLLPENTVEAEEFFKFISVAPKEFEQYRVVCDPTQINNYLIAAFEVNAIRSRLTYLDTIKSKFDLTKLIQHISTLVSALTPATPSYQEILSNAYEVGKILTQDGKLPFVIPEKVALALLAADPVQARNVDLVLSVIKANLTNDQASHMSDAAFKKVTGDQTYLEQFVNSYHYYLNYEELITYCIQFSTPLVKNAVMALTKTEGKVEGKNIIHLIIKYNDIKQTIFDNQIELCNEFVRKLDSFYATSEISFISEEDLSTVTTIIKDNHSVDCSLINDIIVQANEYIDRLEKDKWVIMFKDAETSQDMKLYRALDEVNKYKKDKLPLSAYTAYAEVIKAMSKKEIPIPGEIDFWNRILSQLSGNFINIYKDVRDELLNYQHDEVTAAELLFFGKGLFQFGKLDEDQKTADDTLRRILIPLASNDVNYIEILKGNVKIIGRIINRAQDSIIDFKTALESKCPGILEDVAFNEATSVLTAKYDAMSDGLSEANSQKKE